MKKTKAPLKGLTVPSNLQVDDNVMRSPDPKHDHLKTPNSNNRRWFPDDAVGVVNEIVFDVRRSKFQVTVRFDDTSSYSKNGVYVASFPRSMNFDVEQLEITEEDCKSPKPSLIPSTMTGNGSYASDLSASRVKVKPGSDTAKNTNFKKNMIGLVREVSFKWSMYRAGEDLDGGFYARVEIPFMADNWYRCDDLVVVKKVDLKGPKMKHKWFAGTLKQHGSHSHSWKRSSLSYKLEPKLDEQTSSPTLVDKDMTPKKWHLVQTITFDIDVLPMSRNGYSLPTQKTFRDARRMSTRRLRLAHEFKKMTCTGDVNAYDPIFSLCVCVSLSLSIKTTKQTYRYKNALENGVFALSDLRWLSHELKHYNENDVRAGTNNIQVKSIVKADIQKVRRALVVAARTDPYDTFGFNSVAVHGHSNVRNELKRFQLAEHWYHLAKIKVDESEPDTPSYEKAQKELMHAQVARSRIAAKNVVAQKVLECDKAYRENKKCDDAEMKKLVDFLYVAHS